ncbi:Abi family protein (plasmid) [Psychrobacillus glaciei]|uniref:Abi family protein n=1 Tax=Psychrobacillus glaciei TaxID=2283160 RepID=A0A5J6SUP8_9BACI|nr:Abi family protein [Psychrobacillus glaciei]QFG01294.1 Abi family protein [Psychrobacillus glaciei]
MNLIVSVIQLPYKAKKTANQLIKDVFKENGVQFKLISENDAIPYLEERNYYYKFACYRKNFSRNKKNKYIDLDFQYLISLSKLDKELRYILLQMTLEIEHFLKVKILKDISYNNQVDGYEIVSDYITSYNDKHSRPISIDLLIDRGKSQNSVSHGIYTKVINNQKYIAIWQLIELMQMYELQYFFDYYFTRFQQSDIKVNTYKSLIVSSSYIRNAAAHNSPLLVNLASCPSDAFTSKGINNRYINSLLKPHLKDAAIDLAVKPTYRFKDIAAVLKLYKLLRVSPTSSIDPIIDSLRNLLDSINNKPPCPKLNNDVMTFFTNLQKLFVDIYK